MDVDDGDSHQTKEGFHCKNDQYHDIGNHNEKRGQGRKITVTKGAVTSDHELCSEIGRDILAEGGSAVDAAIATLLSNGVLAPQSMGIGGGCYMIIFDAKRKQKIFINGKQRAPLSAKHSDFVNTKGNRGAKLIAVPGEISAYWKAHQKFGKLPWHRLFAPSIDLLENGFHLSYSVERTLQVVEAGGYKICNLKGLNELFCDANGKILKKGSFVKWPKLAETYKEIAEHGPSFFYTGTAAETMAKEIQDMGGIITADDFANYEAKMTAALEFDLGEEILLTSGSPSGGPIMGLALNILKEMNLNPSSLNDTKGTSLTLHMIIEAMKFAHGQGYKLIDPDYDNDINKMVKEMSSNHFAKHLRQKIDLSRTHDVSYYTRILDDFNDEGTSHVAVLAPNGDAVSVSSSIRTYYGSLTVSESTGIIWNNGMANFHLNEEKTTEQQLLVSDKNNIEPGKEPRSSTAPAIFLDKKTDSVKMIVGSAGAGKIPFINVQVAIRHLWLGQDLQAAVRAKRIFHTLVPTSLIYEQGFSQDILEELKKYGHDPQIVPSNAGMIVEGVVQAISRNKTTGEITGFSDERKPPGKAMFYTTEEMIYN